MIYLSAQPDTDYYVWQLKVQMNNFRRLGIEKDAVILFGYTNKINPNAKKFQKQTKATVLFYEDTRENVQYIPSIRPHIIAKYYAEKGNEISGHDLFYHDSDIIFRDLPDWKTLSESNRVSLSDTISYIGADYIRSKGEGLLEGMCRIVGINPEIVKSRNSKSGGAQTYIPSKHKLSEEFWKKVERNSEDLFQYMRLTEHQYSPHQPIQAWTADMWAVLWNIWLLNVNTEVVPELSFSWATSGIAEWNRHKIMHNAGVIAEHKNLFYKAEYIKKSPFTADLTYVDKRYCSHMYAQEILMAKENFK